MGVLRKRLNAGLGHREPSRFMNPNGLLPQAFDVGLFTTMKAVDPKPPHVLFMAWRLVELLLCGTLAIMNISPGTVLGESCDCCDFRLI